MEIVINIGLVLLYIAWAIVVVCIVYENSIILVILGTIAELARYRLYWYIIARFNSYPIWSYLFAVIPAVWTIGRIMDTIAETIILDHVVPRKLNSDYRFRILNRLVRIKTGDDWPLSDILVNLVGRDIYHGDIRIKEVNALKAKMDLFIKGMAIIAALLPIVVKYIRA